MQEFWQQAAGTCRLQKTRWERNGFNASREVLSHDFEPSQASRPRSKNPVSQSLESSPKTSPCFVFTVGLKNKAFLGSFKTKNNERKLIWREGESEKLVRREEREGKMESGFMMRQEKKVLDLRKYSKLRANCKPQRTPGSRPWTRCPSKRCSRQSRFPAMDSCCHRSLFLFFVK